MTPSSSTPTAVVWFRRDLRLHDHPALVAALAEADRVAPLFVLDPALIAGRWRSPNRTWFMLASLAELATSLDRMPGADEPFEQMRQRTRASSPGIPSRESSWANPSRSSTPA